MTGHCLPPSASIELVVGRAFSASGFVGVLQAVAHGILYLGTKY
jgi:hypothetical protein